MILAQAQVMQWHGKGGQVLFLVDMDEDVRTDPINSLFRHLGMAFVTLWKQVLPMAVSHS